MNLFEYFEEAKNKGQKQTLDEFGAGIGVSGEAVRRYLNGERMPRPDTIAEIERVTNNLVCAPDIYEYYTKRQREKAEAAQAQAVQLAEATT